MMIYYQLLSNVDWLPHADVHWHHDALGKYLCPGCKDVLSAKYPRSIDIVVQKVPSKMCNGGVWHTGIRLMRNDTRETLREWLGDYAFGEVRDSEGHLLPFSTCYCQETVLVYHGPGSIYYLCSLCQSRGSQWNADPSEFLAGEVRGRPVVQSDSGVMYVREDVADILKQQDWPDLELVVTVDVVDTPSFPVTEWI